MTPKLPKIPRFAPAPPRSLKHFAPMLDKYTPLLRSGASLASFAGHALHLKPLRAVGQVLRAVHLAASLANGVRQFQKLSAPQAPKAPQPSSPKVPRPTTPPLPPRAPAIKPLPAPRAPSPAQNRPQQAPGPSPGSKPASAPPYPYKPLFPIGPGTPAAFPHWNPPKPSAPKPGADAPSAGRVPTSPGAAGKTALRAPARPTALRPLPPMPEAERRTAARLAGMDERGGGRMKSGLRFRGESGGEDAEDDKLDDLLDEAKEANKLLKDILEAVKEKPGNPKRQDGSPDGSPEDDGKSVNQLIDGGKIAEGASEAAEGSFMESFIETALDLGALAAG